MVSRRSCTKRCFDGHESWSETFFGSANGPPLPPPGPLTCMSPELWILPWGMRKLTKVSPEPQPPLNLVKISTKLEEEGPYERFIVIHGSVIVFEYLFSFPVL